MTGQRWKVAGKLWKNPSSPKFYSRRLTPWRRHPSKLALSEEGRPRNRQWVSINKLDNTSCSKVITIRFRACSNLAFITVFFFHLTEIQYAIARFEVGIVLFSSHFRSTLNWFARPTIILIDCTNDTKSWHFVSFLIENSIWGYFLFPFRLSNGTASLVKPWCCSVLCVNSNNEDLRSFRVWLNHTRKETHS